MAMMNEVVGRSGRRMSLCSAVLAVTLLCVPASRAFAVYMTMDATKTPAGTVKLCIGLDAGGQKVAGTQNDLVWDGACSNLKANSCAAVPDSKKPLHGNAPTNLQSTYRALVFALDNVEPIRDGQLYCCEFELKGTADACCAVRLDRLGASDPVGTALTMTGNPEKLCLASGSPAPGGAPPPPAAVPAPGAGGGHWLWLVLIAVAVVLVAILVLRGRSS